MVAPFIIGRGKTQKNFKKRKEIAISKIKNILKNRTYLGWICYKGEWIKAKHESVITQEEFDKVQEILSRKEKRIPIYLKKMRDRNASLQLLSF